MCNAVAVLNKQLHRDLRSNLSVTFSASVSRETALYPVTVCDLIFSKQPIPQYIGCTSFSKHNINETSLNILRYKKGLYTELIATTVSLTVTAIQPRSRPTNQRFSFRSTHRSDILYAKQRRLLPFLIRRPLSFSLGCAIPIPENIPHPLPNRGPEPPARMRFRIRIA
jgi:hypothetical protein